VLHCVLRPATVDLLSFNGTATWDLHSLLFPGRLTWQAPGETPPALGGTASGLLFPALVQLVLALETAVDGATHRRRRPRQAGVGHAAAGGYTLSGHEGTLRLELGDERAPAAGFSAVELGRALLTLCRKVASRVLELNPDQANNLRLREFLQDLGDAQRQMAGLAAVGAQQPLDTTVPVRRRSLPTMTPQSPVVAGSVRKLRHERRWELPWHTARPPRHLSLRAGRLVAACEERVCVVDPQTGGLLMDRRDVSGGLSWAVTQGCLAIQDRQGRLQIHDLEAGLMRALWRRREPSGGRLSHAGGLIVEQGARPLLVLHQAARGLLALGLDDGAVAWRVPGPGVAPGWLTRAGDALLWCDGSGVLQAHRCDTGGLAWRTTVPSRLGAPPRCVGSSVVLAGGERPGAPAEVMAFDVTTGRPLWRRTFGDGVPRGVTTDGENVYASAPLRRGARVACLRAADGALQWQRALGGLGFDAPGTPLLFEDQILCRSDHGQLTSFGATDGSLRWRRSACVDGGLHLLRAVDPVVAKRVAFVATDRVRAFGLEQGRPLGTVGEPGRNPEALAVDADLSVYVGDDEGLSAYTLRAALGVVSGS